ncbi:phosphoribosylanthranilate isomerase [bacterium]|nr:phosphoribosylanthranilate isomerase [bacterium]
MSCDTTVRIKICGITCLEDAMMCSELGVHALGFVFAPSRRRIDPRKARSIIRHLPSTVVSVGVFQDMPARSVLEISDYTGIDRIQLHGSETRAYCRALNKKIIKRLPVLPDDSTQSLYRRMDGWNSESLLLDPGSGEGRLFEWKRIGVLCRPFILAGGLTPENVRETVRLMRPAAVDVSSGVEAEPGKKSRDRIVLFIREVCG